MPWEAVCFTITQEISQHFTKRLLSSLSINSFLFFHAACLEMSHAAICALSTCLSFLFSYVRKRPFSFADSVDHWVLNYTVIAIDKDSRETMCCIVPRSIPTLPVDSTTAQVLWSHLSSALWHWDSQGASCCCCKYANLSSVVSNYGIPSLWSVLWFLHFSLLTGLSWEQKWGNAAET